MSEREELARIAVDRGLKIHQDLGPGLLESVYEVVLAASLVREGLSVERQRSVDIVHDGVSYRDAFRVDVLVGRRLIIDIKSVERLATVHGKQILTYLRLTRQPLELLMNFGAATFREGCNVSSAATRTSRLRVFACTRKAPVFDIRILHVHTMHIGDR